MTSLDRGNDVSPEEAAVPGTVRRWRAFSLLAVSYFMTVVDLTIVNVALPTIGRKLHFPESDLQWVVTAYSLALGGFLLLGGRAADLLGRRRLFMAGLAIFTGASLGCALATADTFLIIMRGLQGLGAAVLLPAALSIVMNMFSEGAERNKALGLWGGIGAAGAEAPLLPLRLFRLRTLAGSNAVGFLLGASFFAFIFIGTLYMQQVLGYSALKTGVAWLATSVTGLALAGPAQMLVTRASAKLVMAAGMTMVGAGILWATQIHAHGNFWTDLAGPLFMTGACTLAFIPVSIGALAGVAGHDAGVASGLLNTSQQIGGAIGVAIASTVAATRTQALLSQGHATAAALTGGFQWALWVSGLTGLAAVPVTFLLIRRRELARAAATALQREAPVPASAD